eukprot:TRINITY_DN16336_c1_g1_i1.p1 TRINITY_DN16336_c1_g1~~TRINITY_DN16336_c1_g1_i1.p1  ORF type:complete len:404 (+),score=112.45 TRINITY_DN16336_c1_g1_i1:66-1277(+)
MSSVCRFALAVSVGLAAAHPQKFSSPPPPVADGEIPPIRSFHVHTLYHLRRHNDACHGYDQAMALREKFMTAFDMHGRSECQSDFDQGDLCMFVVSMGPFGPFTTPEWAVFVPVDRYAAVTQWFIQHRGPLTVFIHPNTGYERNDHSDWAMWAGEAYPLALDAPEFSKQLSPMFNTTCRDAPASHTLPPHNAGQLDEEKAHIKFVGLLSGEETVAIDGPTAPKKLKSFDQTWYQDVDPAAAVTFTVRFANNVTKAVRIEALTAGRYITIFVAHTPAVAPTVSFLDDVKPKDDTESRIRVVNFWKPDGALALTRDGGKIGAAPFAKAVHDVPTSNAQHMYRLSHTAAGTGALTEPYYTNAGHAVTVVALGGLPSAENPKAAALLVFDWPHDAPRNDPYYLTIEQ